MSVVKYLTWKLGFKRRHGVRFWDGGILYEQFGFRWRKQAKAFAAQRDGIVFDYEPIDLRIDESVDAEQGSRLAAGFQGIGGASPLAYRPKPPKQPRHPRNH